MPIYARIKKNLIKTSDEKIKKLDELLDSNKELDNKFKNYIKDELVKWVNKNKGRIIEEYKELYEEYDSDLVDTEEVLVEFSHEDPIKNIINNFTDGLEEETTIIYSNIVDRIFSNYYNEFIDSIDDIFINKKTSNKKFSTLNEKTSKKKVSTLNKISEEDIDFSKILEESMEKSQKMNKILLKKLDTYLNDKFEDIYFEENEPDVETILDDFIKEKITSEFVEDNFNVQLSKFHLDKLHDYIYNNFDDLYDEIDSKIEDEKDGRSEPKDSFDQRDFI